MIRERKDEALEEVTELQHLICKNVREIKDLRQLNLIRVFVEAKKS